MELFRLLNIDRGVTAVIGSGGKTTLLRTLGEELPGRVILCTTTHIRPFEGIPLYTGSSEAELGVLLSREGLVCAGEQGGPEGKLTAAALPMARLEKLADYVLVEADGSRQLPMKAHAPHEPVIPPESRRVVCVVGASGFGARVAETVHRPEVFCRLTGAALDTRVTPELVAGAIGAERLAEVVFVNQVETEEDWARAEKLAKALAPMGISVAAGSLHRKVCRLLGDR